MQSHSEDNLFNLVKNAEWAKIEKFIATNSQAMFIKNNDDESLSPLQLAFQLCDIYSIRIFYSRIKNDFDQLESFKKQAEQTKSLHFIDHLHPIYDEFKHAYKIWEQKQRQKMKETMKVIIPDLKFSDESEEDESEEDEIKLLEQQVEQIQSPHFLDGLYAFYEECKNIFKIGLQYLWSQQEDEAETPDISDAEFSSDAKVYAGGEEDKDTDTDEDDSIVRQKENQPLDDLLIKLGAAQKKYLPIHFWKEFFRRRNSWSLQAEFNEHLLPPDKDFTFCRFGAGSFAARNQLFPLDNTSLGKNMAFVATGAVYSVDQIKMVERVGCDIVTFIHLHRVRVKQVENFKKMLGIDPYHGNIFPNFNLQELYDSYKNPVYEKRKSNFGRFSFLFKKNGNGAENINKFNDINVIIKTDINNPLNESASTTAVEALMSRLDDKMTCQYSASCKVLTLFFKDNLHSRLYGKLLRAIVDEKKEDIIYILNQHTELLITTPPKSLSIESSNTYQRFFADKPFMMALKHNQLTMVKLIIPFFRILEEKTGIDGKSEMLQQWNLAEQQLVNQVKYLNFDAMYEAFIAKDLDDESQNQSQKNFFSSGFDISNLKAKNLVNEFQLMICPLTAIKIEHFNIEILLIEAFRIFETKKDAVMVASFVGGVIGFLQSLVPPSLAQILCQGLCEVVDKKASLSIPAKLCRLKGVSESEGGELFYPKRDNRKSFAYNSMVVEGKLADNMVHGGLLKYHGKNAPKPSEKLEILYNEKMQELANLKLQLISGKWPVNADGSDLKNLLVIDEYEFSTAFRWG